jgi:hypothetical protein
MLVTNKEILSVNATGLEQRVYLNRGQLASRLKVSSTAFKAYGDDAIFNYYGSNPFSVGQFE